MSTQERLPGEFEEYLNTKYNGYYEWCDKIGYYRNIETHGAVFEPELTGLMVEFLNKSDKVMNITFHGDECIILELFNGEDLTVTSLADAVTAVCEANK